MSKLMTVDKEYRSILPYNLIAIYKKGGRFRDMIEDSLTEYPELYPLIAETFDEAQAFVYNRESFNIFMFVTDNLSIDVLVHECTHAVFAIYDIIGQVVDRKNDEFFAYLTEHVFREYYSMITDNFKLKIQYSRVNAI